MSAIPLLRTEKYFCTLKFIILIIYHHISGFTRFINAKQKQRGFKCAISSEINSNAPRARVLLLWRFTYDMWFNHSQCPNRRNQQLISPHQQITSFPYHDSLWWIGSTDIYHNVIIFVKVDASLIVSKNWIFIFRECWGYICDPRSCRQEMKFPVVLNIKSFLLDCVITAEWNISLTYFPHCLHPYLLCLRLLQRFSTIIKKCFKY